MHRSSALAAMFAAASTLAAPALAHAAVGVSSVAYDAAPGAGEALVATFDAPTAAGYTVTGGELHQGALVVGVAAPPAGDDSKYLAVTQAETATFTSDAPMAALSVYLGSIDTYNTITFAGPGGFSQTLNGTDLISGGYGDQFSGEANRRFTFDFAADPVTSVTFNSNGNSFELDNIAVKATSAAPEPGTWALMAAGVGLAGAALRRRRMASFAAA